MTIEQDTKVIKWASNESESHSIQNQQENRQPTSVDTKLPGIIANSQPNTPRPINSNISAFSTSSQIRHVTKGRTLNVFTAETGPFFSPTRSFENLYASNKRDLLTPLIQARMDRGFFLTDNEWTCYRRNYFQVSSVFSLLGYTSDNGPYVYVKSNDVFHPVQRFMIGISASVANSDREIELVQQTPKRDKGPQSKPAPKPVALGGNLNVSSSMGNGGIAVFERIQFKTATANNGKRRAAQQYFACYVNLYAETDRYELIHVATCQSAPLVVRGRSPGHYADSCKIRSGLKHSSVEGYHRYSESRDEAYSYPRPLPPSQQEDVMPYYYTPQYPVPSPTLSQQQPPYGSQYDDYDTASTPKLQPYMSQNITDYHEWQRSRYNSTSSGSSSVPSPQPHEQQPHYFTQQEYPHRSSFSPTTPTYVPAALQQQNKFNGLPSLLK